MKTLLNIFIYSIFIYNCFGQMPRQFTKPDLIEIDNNIELKSRNLKNRLIDSQSYTDNLFVEFAIDTFKIEERQRLKLDINYTTTGMVVSALDANKEYDILLNKYYKVLLKSLNEKDKEILRKTQRNWIDFRNSELELNRALTDDYYSGGGTIQQVISVSRVLELTKNRVFEFYYYLDRKSF